MRFWKRLRKRAALPAAVALLTAVLLLHSTVAAETTTSTTAATATADTTTATAATTATAPDEPTTEPTEPAAPVTEPTVPHRVLIDADTPLDASAQWIGALGAEDYANAHFEDGRNGKKALRFDGTQYMLVDMRNREVPFTLSFFVNWQADLSAEEAAGQYLFSVKLKDAEDGLFCLPCAKDTAENGDIINGLLLSAVCYQKDGWQRQSFYYPAARTVSNGLPVYTWHHIAFVAEQRSVSLYLDGLLWKTVELDFDYSALKADSLLIGANDTVSARFTGLMQDLRLYDGALTAEQVCRLAQDADPFDPTVTVTPRTYAPIAAKEVFLEKTYTAQTADGKTAIAPSTDLAFWEAPQVDAGQSITGTLTIENRSKHTVNMALTAVTLPEKGTAAWDYLATLQLTVQKDGETLFAGPYVEVAAKLPSIAATDMSYSRRVQYTVTLSRGFAQAGGVVAVNVPWEMTVTLADAKGRQPQEGRHVALLVILLLSAAALIAGVYCAVEKRDCPFFTVWNTVWEKHLRPIVKKCATVLRRKKKISENNEEETPQ